VLVLTIWAQGGGADDLRARLRATLDVETGTDVERALAGRDAILAEVERWVDAVRPAG
jgi:hypothetical protein